MYKVPWSVTDNQGGWVEVTDNCNLNCHGCYREKKDGDRTLDEIKREIIECKRVTNCDVMVIAGGEPLLYPDITEVVRFISSLKMKPLILSNGLLLSEKLAAELKKAGLARIHFHIDSLQERDGWEGKSEVELNELRQYFADILWKVGTIQCGFHITVTPATLQSIPSILSWQKKNINKVQHISFIALRGIPIVKGIEYFIKTRKIPRDELLNSFDNPGEISLTTDEMFEIVQEYFPQYFPCAFINGSTILQPNKYLIYTNIGSINEYYGSMGAATFELSQIFYHFFKGRYLSFLSNPMIGKKVFLLSIVDKHMRKALSGFMIALLRNPFRLFEKIYIQSFLLQQPIEFVGCDKNICDSCINPMIYKEKIINPCQLDEYRKYDTTIEAFNE